MKKNNSNNELDAFVNLLIPPSLVLLLIVTIIELFYGFSQGMSIFIDFFDLFVIIIFAIDLYFRWFETPHLIPYIKKHYLDIIATIPFNLIFLGLEGLTMIRALRGVRIIARVSRFAKFARYAKFIRLLRFAARAPRFLRFRKHVKKAKIRKVQPHEKQMKGVLSFRVILLITINSIMGTGIWFLTSAGAKHAGPASLISWAILSLISVYIAMCFAELTSMFPKAGGVYEFAKQAYGRFWSFVIGWTTSIAGSVTIAMLLLGALQYLIPIDYSFTYVPVAIFLIVLFSLVALRGMQTSTVVLVTFALITLVAVIAIIIPGFLNFNPENFKPFFVLPSMSILLAIFFIAETFFGWESAIFLSAETKNPTKVMPKALIYGTIVISVLAFLLAFTAMGTIPWADYAESTAPLRDLGAAHFGFVGGLIFTFLIFVSVIGATAGWIVTAPRLLMSLAEDKLFFTQFAKIDPKHKSPYVSIIFQALVVSILVIVGAGSYETLLHILIPLILIVYSAVLLSVIILRFKKPDQPRPYRVIFGKIGPLFTIFFMIFLLVMFIKETHGAMEMLKISISLIVFGIPAYFAIELFYDPKYVHLRRELMAKMHHHYHKKNPMSNRLFDKIIMLVGPFNSKKRLVDFDCRTGVFIKRIVEKGLEYKEISAIDTSKNELNHFKKYLKLMDSKHRKRIKVHYRKSWKLSSKVKKSDVFVSFNTLGYIENLPLFLKHLKQRLNKNAKFCFYIKNHVLNVTPNALITENEKKVKNLFKNAGLKVNYKRKKRMFKEEIFIYGSNN
ncbi:amino acid permease [Candidatus Woesearchaeota archaeon]|jgi:basic amino acid/polyamine antiporter, APA family|nr:amino acid permease [Candidatus Woesearchaeota archaeon]MBT5272957.1 amino acid permease [Candidatus Woesearchaeota archaeon]MBT6041423.1 amino acid permease [Candidatus Woesearchaeota archaeon]MBT6337306.1 amino acid permease [Candidatus Woesearchaeota archaeon]MBT7927183.1 amino acid permease [Candidatus Woesearchaeota archaeon]